MCTYGRIALPDKEKEKEKTDKTGYLSDDDITVFSKLLTYFFSKLPTYIFAYHYSYMNAIFVLEKSYATIINIAAKTVRPITSATIRDCILIFNPRNPWSKVCNYT